VLKRTTNGDIKNMGSSVHHEYDKLSVYLAQVFIPRSAQLYPLDADNVQWGRNTPMIPC
jgi:hypothetical protein